VSYSCNLANWRLRSVYILYILYIYIYCTCKYTIYGKSLHLSHLLRMMFDITESKTWDGGLSLSLSLYRYIYIYVCVCVCVCLCVYIIFLDRIWRNIINITTGFRSLSNKEWYIPVYHPLSLLSWNALYLSLLVIFPISVDIHINQLVCLVS